MFHYITSANTVNKQGVEYNPPTRMDHTYYYLISYFNWKTHMTTLSATILWANHIKAPLTTFSLILHGLKIWPYLSAAYLWLLLLINLNLHTLFHNKRITSAVNLLYLSLHIFNLYFLLQPRIQPLNPVMKIYTRTMCNHFPYGL